MTPPEACLAGSHHASHPLPSLPLLPQTAPAGARPKLPPAHLRSAHQPRCGKTSGLRVGLRFRSARAGGKAGLIPELLPLRREIPRLRRPTLSQGRTRKKESACSARNDRVGAVRARTVSQPLRAGLTSDAPPALRWREDAGLSPQGMRGVPTKRGKARRYENRKSEEGFLRPKGLSYSSE